MFGTLFSLTLSQFHVAINIWNLFVRRPLGSYSSLKQVTHFTLHFFCNSLPASQSIIFMRKLSAVTHKYSIERLQVYTFVIILLHILLIIHVHWHMGSVSPFTKCTYAFQGLTFMYVYLLFEGHFPALFTLSHMGMHVLSHVFVGALI